MATEPLAERLEDRPDLVMFSRLAMLVPDLSLVLHAFPLDPALPGLVLATDPEELMVMLGPALTSAVEGLTLQGCGVEVVRYGRGTCVLRYELVWRLQPSRRTLKQVVYGKVYRDAAGALVGPAVSALRRESLGGRNALPFLVPRFQAYLPDLRLTLLEAVPGAPQLPALIRARAGAGLPPAPAELTARDAVRTAGRIAAALHESSAPTGPARTFADELDRARAEVEDLAPLAPRLASALHEHLDEPQSVAADVPMASTVAHGDFDLSRVLFDGPTSSVVEFGTICHAEPGLDLGRFTASLAVTARRAEEAAGTGDGAEALGPAFLREYLRQRDNSGDVDFLMARVEAYRTIALVRLAVRSWCELKSQRLGPTLALLERRQHARGL
ncbi:MAG: hypothetical protein ACLGIA_06955 [Actinomycetes bacterium]